jgi:rod shape determining protein RodA
MRRAIPDITYAGWAIVAAVATLIIIGTASIYVTDTHYVTGHDGPANALKQAARVLVGLGLAGLVLHVGYHRVGRFAYGIFALSVVLLLPLLAARVLHTSFGGLITPRNGAYRWIQVPGLLIQPSEVAKLAFVVALAWYLRHRKHHQRFGGLLIPILVATVPLALILVEPDLGTALLLVPVMFVMLFAAGANVWHLGGIAIAGLAVVPFAWRHVEDYQRLRVTSLVLQSEALRRAVIENPDQYAAIATKRQALEWAASAGYQLVYSKNAIGSGGVFGQGFGRGVYVENPLLPDRHNDFVFALVAHQWGLGGALLVLTCYGVIIVAGARIASMTAEPFASVLATGLVALMASQATINIGMAMGLLPITGMTLPFISYGGSSLLISFVAVALLISVSQHRPYLLTHDPFVFRREHHEGLHAPCWREADSSGRAAV